MTFVDPRAGTIATFAALSAEIGVPIDGDLAASRLGPPLEVELAHWVPEEQIAETAIRYRAHFATVGVEPTIAFPGAAAALAAVHEQGGETLVLTAKSTPMAQATLDRLGLVASETIGFRWGPTKGEVLAERGAAIYVGDHTGDMVAALSCGAVAVAITTGPDDEAALRDAGAEVVLSSLEEFPAWLSAYVLDQRLARLGERLQELGSVLVAFSGGADSAFLLAAAVRALGPDRVAAATAISPSLPASELEDARQFAADARRPAPHPDHRRAVARRLPRQRRRPLLLLQGRAARRSASAGRRARTGLRGDRHQRRRCACRFPAGHPRRGRARRGHSAARRRLDQGSGTRCQPRSGHCRPGTSRRPPACRAGSRTASRSPPPGCRGSSGPRPHCGQRLPVRGSKPATCGSAISVIARWSRSTPSWWSRSGAVPELLSVVEGFDVVELDPRGFRTGAMNELLADADRWR